MSEHRGRPSVWYRFTLWLAFGSPILVGLLTGAVALGIVACLYLVTRAPR